MGRLSWIAIVGVGLLIGACNMFDVSRSDSKTVDALLTDARSALRADRTARAVRLLERAFEKDATDVRVRVELGNALYADRGVDVFTLRAAVEPLVQPSKVTSRSPSGPFPRGADSVCTDDTQPEASPDRFASVPLDADPLRRLVEHGSVVRRVRRLVVEGVLERRSGAFSDAGVRIRRKGLLIGAATVVAMAGIEVHEVFTDTESALFVENGGESGRALVACANSKSGLTDNHEALCVLHTAAERATQWLQKRNRLSGSDEATVLSGRLETIAGSVIARIECSSRASASPG